MEHMIPFNELNPTSVTKCILTNCRYNLAYYKTKIDNKTDCAAAINWWSNDCQPQAFSRSRAPVDV